MTASHLPDHVALSWLDWGRDRWLAWRDRLIASPRFQRWAVSFPLTRPIADARARDLFDLVAGFVYAQVLAACVELKVFHQLKAGPLSIEVLAPRLGLSTDGARLLLDAAVTLDLVSRRSGGRYGLGSLGAAFLGNPGLADMVRHHALFYADMADPLALLADTRPPGKLQQFWAYARDAEPAALQSGDIGGYTRLMAASQGFVADDILDAFSFKGFNRLMDLGGGDGSFLTSVAKRWPELKLLLVDLPAVAERAEARFANAGLEARARAVGADFLRDRLPCEADVISLVRVVHDHDDESVKGLLRAAYEALPVGGTLLLAEPMAAAPGAERVGAAYFNFYLRAMGSGRARSDAELQSMLKTAGFGDIRAVRTRRPLLTGLIVARRPA
jgi:demethylspheroidene O-methyltransferase